MTAAPEPILHERRLPVGPEVAFEAFTRHIGEWWDAAYTANPSTFSGAVLEGRLGGRVFGIHSDLGEVSWGTIVGWEPRRHLAWSWTLAQPAEHPSRVEVTFEEADGGGSLLRLAHGGWNEANGRYRDKFGDWSHLLDRFVDHVTRGAGAERCVHCGRDVAAGTPLFARRVTLISEDDPDVAFVCLDCRGDAALVDAEGNPLSEDQLAGMKYVIGRGGRA